jgi:hypothetical protein
MKYSFKALAVLAFAALVRRWQARKFKPAAFS